MMTHHERLAALNAFMCDYDFTSVTIGDSPFTLERPRKAFAFAPPEPGNVYTFPVPDKQEGETVAEENTPKAEKLKTYKLTLDQDAAIKTAIEQHNASNQDAPVTESSLIRDLLERWCDEHGYAFPGYKISQGMRTDNP